MSKKISQLDELNEIGNDDLLYISEHINEEEYESKKVSAQKLNEFVSNNLIIKYSEFPPESNSEGNIGEIKWNGHYLYICVEENKWRRAQLFDY